MRGGSSGGRAAISCAVALTAWAWTAAGAPAAPFAGAETPRGTGEMLRVGLERPAAKAVDGHLMDWTGRRSGFAGVAVRSAGELVYTDHLFDAFGADDGGDASRLAITRPADERMPETYRLHALAENAADQAPVPPPGGLRYRTNYGDVERSADLDLTELRVGTARRRLHVLARTSVMDSPDDAALLLLLDTEPDGKERRQVPFGSGLSTSHAELAFLLTSTSARRADLRTGRVTDLRAGSVAVNPRGWTNAIEAAVPRRGLPRRLGVAAAIGRPADGGRELADLGIGPGVANVAFRREPVREWFEREQALALGKGTIDPFFTRLDLRKLDRGLSERYVPGPGYHDRIFRSSPGVSREEGDQGILQHYALYLPTQREPPAPLQLWLHWRGGAAHSAGHTIPGMFEELGERRGTVVVSPGGRGPTGWYVGRAQVDLREVWRDVHALVRIDPRRRYVAGHSMGGWGSVLMATTRPDWFAAALPASPPVTQGAWTGVDAPGCDELAAGGYTPCYIAANGGRPRDQHSRKLLDNLRNLPVAIFHGAADELVPYAGVARQAERLMQLGYRHRFYTFAAQEHYGPPIWDEWGEGARYLHRFRRPEVPHHVTYVRDMPFERAAEEVNADGLGLDFDFDSAYWMSGLEPVDAKSGRARFDGRSLAIPSAPVEELPEAGGPAAADQVGPWVMTGLRWLEDGARRAGESSNAFAATLTGARAVSLHLRRMRISAARRIGGTVDTDSPLRLTLRGRFRGPVRVTVDGEPVPARVDGRSIGVVLPAGRHALAVVPRRAG